MPPREPEQLGPLDALAFGVELVMLGLLVTSGHLLADGWRGWLLGVGFATIAIAVWARWMAPRSDTRLPNPARLAFETVLFGLTGVLLAMGGHPWWGVGFAVFATAAFAARVPNDP